MKTYRLDFDTPYSDVEEFGWAKSHLLRDLDTRTNGLWHTGCYHEPRTGTVMLQPLHFAPENFYTPTSLLHAVLTDLDHEPAWESHNLLLANDPTYYKRRLRSTLAPASLINTLVTLAADAIYDISGSTLYPLLNTKLAWDINQGLFVEVEAYHMDELYKKNYMGIRFGQFLLALNTSGAAQLYENVGGGTHDWVLRQDIGRPLKNRGYATVGGALVAQNMTTNVWIQPFGRGHILVQTSHGGKTQGDVYTNRLATWSTPEQRYLITTSAKVGIYSTLEYTKNLGVSLSKTGFSTTGTFTDDVYEMPYAPTTTPVISAGWVKTAGAPTVVTTLVDEDGDPFIADGVNRQCGIKCVLTGDGTTSPFIDTTSIRFPPKVTTYTPVSFTTNKLVSLKLRDGENWGDQGCDVIVEELTPLDDSATMTALATRPELRGRLVITDGGADTNYGTYLFRGPRAEVTAHTSRVILSGQNNGVARVTERRFWFPRVYDGLAHSVAVKDILNQCGFPDADIIVDTDTVLLPGHRATMDPDKGETDYAFQPAFNSSCAEFLRHITENYSRWPIRYRADEKWYYQAPAVAAESGVFYKTRSTTTRNRPWYDHELTIELVPPEANYVCLFGRTDSGDVIGNVAIDYDSIHSAVTPKPANYLGRRLPIYILDPAINGMAQLDEVLQRVFDQVSEGIYRYTWRGPFVQALTIGQHWRLEGIGLAQIRSFETEATRPNELEYSPCTTYVGTFGATSTGTYRRRVTAQSVHLEQFFEKIFGGVTIRQNESPDTPTGTTAQKDQVTEMREQIMRQQITWGTAIERGTP